MATAGNVKNSTAVGSELLGNSETTASKERLHPKVESGDFDQLNRKEKDEFNIAKLRVQITKLENALSAEIKRRITSQRQIERACQEQIAAVEDRLSGMMERQSHAVALRVQSLEERMQELQKQVEKVSTEIPKSVEMQAQKVSQQLHRISEDVQQEKKDRFAREGLILKQIQDYEISINGVIEKERVQRQARLECLRDILERNESGRVEADTCFAALLDKELTSLKSQVQQEIDERQTEDDAIVDAMNRYTIKLQSTLNIITSDE